MAGYAVKHVNVRTHHVIMFMDAITRRVSIKTIYFEIDIATLLKSLNHIHKLGN